MHAEGTREAGWLQAVPLLCHLQVELEDFLDGIDISLAGALKVMATLSLPRGGGIVDTIRSHPCFTGRRDSGSKQQLDFVAIKGLEETYYGQVSAWAGLCVLCCSSRSR